MKIATELLGITEEKTPERIKWLTEDGIKEFPIIANQRRDLSSLYVIDAFRLVKDKVRPCSLNKVSECYTVFSIDGKNQLEDLMKPNGTYLYLVTGPPYTFIVGKVNNEHIIIDTHMINTNLGGDGNGVIKLIADERNLRS